MRFRIKEKSQKCKICDLTLSTAGSLRAHIKLHSQENVHMCNQCNYTSSKTVSLKRHKRHHEEKTHKCIQCEYAANNARSVRAHMIKHNGNGSHKCIQCKYSAYFARDLRVHIMTHTGEKPNKCNQCNFSCIQRSSLKYHLMTHVDMKSNKSNKCKYCDHVSSDASCLNDHIKAYHRDLVRKCRDCGYTTFRTEHLKKHVSTRRQAV